MDKSILVLQQIFISWVRTSEPRSPKPLKPFNVKSQSYFPTNSSMIIMKIVYFMDTTNSASTNLSPWHYDKFNSLSYTNESKRSTSCNSPQYKKSKRGIEPFTEANKWRRQDRIVLRGDWGYSTHWASYSHRDCWAQCFVGTSIRFPT